MNDVIHVFSSMYLVFTGFALLLPVLVKTKDDYDVIQRYFWGGRSRLPAGIAGLLLAVALFFWPKNRLILLGDLLPFIVSALDGLILLMGTIQNNRALDKAVLDRAGMILGNLQIPLGALSLLVGLLHGFLGFVILL